MRQRAVPATSSPSPSSRPSTSGTSAPVKVNNSNEKSKCFAALMIMVAVLTMIAIIGVWSSPISPVSYHIGPLAAWPPSGSSLQSLSSSVVMQMAKGLLTAAEAIVFDHHGHLYAGCADGRIVRIDVKHLHMLVTKSINDGHGGNDGPIPTAGNTAKDELIVELITYTGNASRAAAAGLTCGSYGAEPICGRPLGMTFDDDHTLLVADAYYGLLSIDIITRHVRVLTNKISTYHGIHHPADDTIIINDALLAAEYRSIAMNDSIHIRFANCVTRGRDGYIYLTDSSDRWQRRDVLYDTYESQCRGRVLRYDRISSTTVILARGLCFANGLIRRSILSPIDGLYRESLLVAETRRARVIQITLADMHHDRASIDVVAANLPCTPDNLELDGHHTLAADRNDHTTHTTGGHHDTDYMWIGCSSKRALPHARLDSLSSWPMIRRILAGILPRSYLTSVLPHRLGLALRVHIDTAHIVQSWIDNTGDIVRYISGVYVHPSLPLAFIGSWFTDVNFIGVIRWTPFINASITASAFAASA